MSRPIFTIRAGMTDQDVAEQSIGHVVRQPANITFCDLCAQYVKAGHVCTDTPPEPDTEERRNVEHYETDGEDVAYQMSHNMTEEITR
jgi:hypothetical protein